MSRNYWALMLYLLKPVNLRACAPRQEKSLQWETRSLQGRVERGESTPPPPQHTHTHTQAVTTQHRQKKKVTNFKKPQVRRWWSERDAQGFRVFTRCVGADFIMEPRPSPALAAVKLRGKGPSGLLGLLIQYQRKFIASPRILLVKTLDLTLIKSLNPTSSLQEIGSIEEQAKRH